MPPTMKKRIGLFALMTVAAISIALPPMLDLLKNTKTTEYYSHIPLVPAVSLYLIFRRRKEMFRGEASFHPAGISMILGGTALYVTSLLVRTGLNDQASISTLAALLLWWGAYLTLFGRNASKKAFFPFAFLLFAVPIPVFLIESVIGFLVVGSTVMTRLMFAVIGVPLVQEGAVFLLPGFDIEVAKECSGIRSSLALFITTVLAGHIFLREFWKKAVLALAVFPVALFKNAVRIVTIYMLSYFIDMRIIEGGYLHRSGGFIFFGLGLVVLGMILWFLRSWGRRSENT